MRLLMLLAALSVTPACSAQILSVYGTFSPVHAGHVETGSVASSTGYTEQYTSLTASGFGGGVTFGILPVGPLRLGFDLRGSSKPGTVGADLALAGLKVGVRVPVIPFKPYVQGSVGYLATRTLNLSSLSYNSSATIGGTFTNQYLAYEILGGLDYPLVHFFDLRLIEIGGGQGHAILGTANANSNLFTINSGLVFHF